MLKINWKKKLIVMLLIFTLTFGNFALVGKTYAATIFDNLFSNDEGDTGSSNVEFDAKFLVYEKADSDVKQPDDESNGSETKPGNSDESNGPETQPENSDELNGPETQPDNLNESNGSETKPDSSDELNDREAETNNSADRPTEPGSTAGSGELGDKSDDSSEIEALEENEQEEIIAKEKTKVTANVNETNLKLKLALKVLNSGYLKNAKIILGNGEELNFAINTEGFENAAVQSFENNQIELIQLGNGSDVEIELPIYYENSKYVQLENISKTNKIKFEGTYIDGEDEISVSKEVDLKMSWQDERNITINSEVTKYLGGSYIDGDPGVTLQMLVKVDNTALGNALPVNTSSLEVKVPELNGFKPEKITVVANSLLGTTEKEEIIFDENNLTYDEENNILKIAVTNEAKLVSPQKEDEVLIDETLEDVEAYYVGSGVDEYLITYLYKGFIIENTQITYDAVSTYNMYGGLKSSASKEFTFDLEEGTGDVVTVKVKPSTETVSKGYTYLNYNNEENKSEVLLESKIILNVGFKEIVENIYYEDGTNYYVSNSNEKYEQNDIYYKTLKISKTNFNEMLGEEGYIKLFDLDGNLLATIDKQIELKDDEEFYNLSFEGNIKKIRIVTSTPIINGSLVINVEKAYKDVSYDKNYFKQFEKIEMQSYLKVKYTFLDELLDFGNSVTEIKLENTKTNAEIAIGQETLSTLAENQNVEMKIILNNDKISSDVYGESEFEIKMPKYIEKFEVKDYSIVYGEGLEISNISAYEDNGNVYLKINLSGVQKALSSGIISGGTNIVLNANIKVDLYAPASEAEFELRYINSEATQYAETMDGVGYNKIAIKYSAPVGIISVNSISNYNDNGDTVVSVKQGKITGDLSIYSPSKKATMDIIVMNNEENSISNISILGRTIFEGNKDILTGESIGTTANASMISKIIGDQNNGAEFKAYYSTNAEATNDLNNPENGWVEIIEDLAQVRSYLIVPVDENYEFNVESRLHFSYDFEIPGNLPHNEYFYGTFGTYYTNSTPIATLNEVSLPDIVGLTTGYGPELEIKTETSRESVSEFEEFEVTTIVKNIGEVVAKNVNVEVPIPNNTEFVNKNNNIPEIVVSQENSVLKYNLAELDAGAELRIKTVFSVKEIPEDEESKIEIYSTVTADDLGTILQTEVKSINVKQAEFKIKVVDTLTSGRGMVTAGDKIILRVYATNISENAVNNTIVSMYLDEALKFNEKTITTTDRNKEAVVKYNEQTRTITWEVGTLNSYETVEFVVHFDIYRYR